jgi:transposase InsO family protein
VIACELFTALGGVSAEDEAADLSPGQWWLEGQAPAPSGCGPTCPRGPVWAAEVKRIRADDIASDRVERQFARTGPDQLWVTDITKHPTREGKVYCCDVLDTYSRRVVGWSIDSSPTGGTA